MNVQPGEEERNAARPSRIRIAERKAMALELRKQGGSYRAIAETLRGVEGISAKYSATQAYRDITAELQDLNQANAQSADELRRLVFEQLFEMFAVVYHLAVDRKDLFAMDRCLAIHDRITKLYGLDKPNSDQLLAQLMQYVDFSALPGEVIDRLAAGENPIKVLLGNFSTMAVAGTSGEGEAPPASSRESDGGGQPVSPIPF